MIYAEHSNKIHDTLVILVNTVLIFTIRDTFTFYIPVHHISETLFFIARITANPVICVKLQFFKK